MLYLEKCNSIYDDKTLYLKFPVLLYADNTDVFTEEKDFQNNLYMNIQNYYKSKKGGKDQDQIQSSPTPYP